MEAHDFIFGDEVCPECLHSPAGIDGKCAVAGCECEADRPDATIPASEVCLHGIARNSNIACMNCVAERKLVTPETWLERLRRYLW